MDEALSRRVSEIRLPADSSERYSAGEMASISRAQTFKQFVSRPPSTHGTFYGRRDFESKQDDDVDGKGKPSEDGLFHRLTSLASPARDTDSEEDDEDDGSHSEH